MKVYKHAENGKTGEIVELKEVRGYMLKYSADGQLSNYGLERTQLEAVAEGMCEVGFDCKVVSVKVSEVADE